MPAEKKLAKGEIVAVTFDYHNQKPISLPEEIGARQFQNSRVCKIKKLKNYSSFITSHLSRSMHAFKSKEK